MLTVVRKLKVVAHLGKDKEKDKGKDTGKFKIRKEKLDLQENVEGIYICRGQTEGSHPVFISPDSLLAENLMFQVYKNILYRGVVLTMTNVRKLEIRKLGS